MSVTVLAGRNEGRWCSSPGWVLVSVAYALPSCICATYGSVHPEMI